MLHDPRSDNGRGDDAVTPFSPEDDNNYGSDGGDGDDGDGAATPSYRGVGGVAESMRTMRDVSAALPSKSGERDCTR
jgi:hypothetical protein